MIANLPPPPPPLPLSTDGKQHRRRPGRPSGGGKAEHRKQPFLGTGRWECPGCPCKVVQQQPHTPASWTRVMGQKWRHIKRCHPNVDTSKFPWSPYLNRATLSSRFATRTYWKCPVKDCRVCVPDTPNNSCTRPQLQKLRKQHWKDKHSSMGFSTFVNLGRQRTCAAHKSHASTFRLEMTSAITRIMRIPDPRGHAFRPLPMPRVIQYKQQEVTRRHQVQIQFACNKCYYIAAACGRIGRACGTVTKAAGDWTMLDRLRADSKLIGKVACPNSVTPAQLRQFYTEGIAAIQRRQRFLADHAATK